MPLTFGINPGYLTVFHIASMAVYLQNLNTGQQDEAADNYKTEAKHQQYTHAGSSLMRDDGQRSKLTMVVRALKKTAATCWFQATIVRR